MNPKGIAALVAACLVVGTAVWWGISRSRGPGAPSAASANPLFQQQDPPMNVWVYYATSDGSLEPEERTIYQSAERMNQMKQALLELSKPPLDPNHVATLPEGAMLREAYVDAQRVAYLDWSAELTSRHPGGSWGEWLTVQAMAATLMKNFEEIRYVQVLVDGRAVESLKGHVELARPVGLDGSIIRAPSTVSLAP